MGKIAFVRLSDETYGSVISKEIGQRALINLRNKNIKFIYNENPILNTNEASQFGKKICAENVDGILIFLESFSEPIVPIALIQEIKTLPITLWGYPMVENNKIKEPTGSIVFKMGFSL